MSKIMPLKRCELFQGFSFGELSLLAPFFLEEGCKPGYVLTKEKSNNHGLMVVASGHLQLSQPTRTQGLSLRLGMGESFGEFSLIDTKSESEFEVQADEGTELLRMSPHDFQSLKHKNPVLALKLLEGIICTTRTRIESIKSVLV